jgi:hypothetical protein
MKAQTKKAKIIAYFQANPNAVPKNVAAKFNVAIPTVYPLRKQAMHVLQEQIAEEQISPQVAPLVEDNKATINVNKMLAGREARYGAFEDHAEISQSLKAVMYAQTGWARLSKDQRESLEMVQHKIARILNGDPSYLDNWVDICGYSQLVVNRLEKENK